MDAEQREWFDDIVDRTQDEWDALESDRVASTMAALADFMG